MQLFVEMIDNNGIANALLKKIEKGNVQPFINQVKVQSGKHITVDAAEYFTVC